MVDTTFSPQNERVGSFPPSQPCSTVPSEIKRQPIAKRILKGIYYRVWGQEKRIVLKYRSRRWEFFDSLHPWSIGEALHETLERVEEAVPGSLEKAARCDDEDWLANERRTRRRIAESPDLLYINSPHLNRYCQAVAGYYVITNISWQDVPEILQLVCKAAGIECRPLAEVRF